MFSEALLRTSFKLFSESEKPPLLRTLLRKRASYTHPADFLRLESGFFLYPSRSPHGGLLVVVFLHAIGIFFGANSPVNNPFEESDSSQIC